MTRIPIVHVTVADAEIRAMMRRMARDGYVDANDNRLTPAECLMIAEHIIDQCHGLDRSLDLRLLVNSYEDFLQWTDGHSGMQWKDLVTTRVRQRPAGIRSQVEIVEAGHSRAAAAARQQADLDIAREIAAATGDPKIREQMWKERTAKSRATLYRRLAELGS